MVTPEGMHLRGGNQGLDYYWPLQLPQQSTPLRVRFTGFSLFNKKVKPDSKQPPAAAGTSYWLC